jgi:hypothetical protein
MTGTVNAAELQRRLAGWKRKLTEIVVLAALAAGAVRAVFERGPTMETRSGRV